MLDGGYDWAIGRRGQTYRQIGRYDQALADLDNALELDSSDDWSHYLRSVVHMALGHKSKAAADLQSAVDLARRSVRLAPAPSIDAYNLALYLAASRDVEQARRQFVSALKDCPNQWWVLEAIGDLRELSSTPGYDAAGIGELIGLLEHSAP